MATSSMPSAAFAADLFSDGSAVEFAAEATDAFTEDAAAPVEEAAVFAEEADTEDTALQASDDAYRVQPDTIKFKYSVEKPSYKVEYEEHLLLEDGSFDPEHYKVVETTAVVNEELTKEATCTTDGVLVLKVQIDGDWYNSGQYITKEKLGHKDQEIDRKTLKVPDHIHEGLAHVWYKCEVCGYEHDEDLRLSPQEHTWGSVTYENGNNIKVENGKVVLGEDGLPMLDDVTQDGWYWEVIYCTEDKTEKPESRVRKEIYAKKGIYGVIVDSTGIATPLVGKIYYKPTVQLPLPEEEIELTDCSKEGNYIVRYYTRDDKEISEELIKVAPHHMLGPVRAEFSTQDDRDQCTVKYDAKNSLVSVTNKSCYLPVTYYEVIHCTAAGCKNKACDAKKYLCDFAQYKEVSRVEKVAEPMGKHIINADVKKVIDEKVKNGATYEALEEEAKKTGSYVKVSNDTSDCENDGTATVEYLCMVCKTTVQTDTVKVVKKGHIDLPPVRENYIAPTCEKEGSYDAVTHCKRCDKVLRDVRKIRIPRLPHTNELRVEQDKNGNDVGVDDKENKNNNEVQVEFLGDMVIDVQSKLADAAGKTNSAATYADVYADVLEKHGKEYTVNAATYTNCSTCGNHRVDLNQVNHKPVITIDSVSKQSKECKPGSITLTATYKKTSVTGTFAYYSTIEEYRGRKTHTPGEAVKENVVEATATENGSYDEVVYCTVCGTEISRKTVTVTATGEIVLPAVTGLAAKATGMNRVALSWDKVEGAEGYFVIGFGENRTGTQIAYTTRTNWTDTAADSDAFNFYWVQPFNRNAAGKIVKGELGGYVYALGRVVSSAGKVTAAATEEGIELNWASVSGANSYVVLSKTGDAAAEFNESVATDTTTYVDTTAEAGEVTYYWVYATYKNADGKVLAAGKTSPFAWAIAK